MNRGRAAEQEMKSYKAGAKIAACSLSRVLDGDSVGPLMLVDSVRCPRVGRSEEVR